MRNHQSVVYLINCSILERGSNHNNNRNNTLSQSMVVPWGAGDPYNRSAYSVYLVSRIQLAPLDRGESIDQLKMK